MPTSCWLALHAASGNVLGRSTRSLGVMKERGREHMDVRLTEAEGELRALLEKVLPRTAQSGEQLFFHSENLPRGYRASMLPVESEQLFSLATECVELREQLEKPLGGSVAQLY